MDKVGKVGAAVLVALLFIALGEGLTIVGTELRATYNQGFATKDVRLTRTGSQLVVKSHTHFTDNSGRADYDSTDTMNRK